MMIKVSLYVIAIVGALALPSKAFAQGCIPAHYMSLSLGANGIQELTSGEWDLGISYRFFHSERVFVGKEEQPQLHAVGGRNTFNSFDLSVAYGLNSHWALNLAIPLAHDTVSGVQDDLQRHSASSGGLGDMRLIATTWLLDPDEHPDGNLNLGFGVKFPTGDYRAMGDFHTADGNVVRRPLDIAAQLGDGGWGIVLQMQAFQKVVQDLYAYAQGLYLINPREKNGTERPQPGSPLVNSVPDQYFARLGLSYVFGTGMEWSASLGGRIDGIPAHDLIGGSGGFRRSGYAVYVDPGLNWSDGENLLSLNIPVAVERYIRPGGGFPDFLVIASYSRRF